MTPSHNDTSTVRRSLMFAQSARILAGMALFVSIPVLCSCESESNQSHQNLTTVGNGVYHPANGFGWLHPEDPHDLRVKWTPRTPLEGQPGVRAAKNEGSW